VLSDSNARLAAARRLTSRRGRREAGRFLAEGAQAVREALASPGVVVDVFATATALDRHRDLLGPSAVSVSEISERAASALSETMAPQGLIAVCERVDVSLATALDRAPALIVVLVEPNDPGNAGAILRTADAAGADAVVFAGDAVDPYNGKTVRATAGSLFHVDVVLAADPSATVRACRQAGLMTVATAGAAAREIDGLALQRPTAWLFGNEAHGLAEEMIAECDFTARVPVYGRAESLNLAAAAAVCLYASARAQRG